MQKIQNEIQQAFNTRFVPPSNYKLDQSINRFDFDKKDDRAMWLIGSEWNYKGNIHWRCTVGNWKDPFDKKIEIKSWDGQPVDKTFEKFAAKKREEELAVIEYEKKKAHHECAEKWGKIFDQSQESAPVHPYIASKGLKDNGIARVDLNGTLLIPARNSEKFVGVQRIYKKGDKFEKRFASGINLGGSFCVIGDINDEYLYIVEGYATGLSVHHATNTSTVCVWNCNNFEKAIRQIRVLNPKSKLIIAADRDINEDKRYHDIGGKKAEQAAKKISNIIVKKVQFHDNDPKEWSDYNDLHNFVSISEVQKQLIVKNSDFMEIIYKGFNRDNECCYFSTKTMILHQLKPSEHTENNLLFMADHQYWGNRYRFQKDKEKNNLPYADFKKVVEQMFCEQREIGKFNFDNIRGYGVNIDDGRIVVNLGNSLWAQNKMQQVFDNDLKSKFFYEANEPLIVDFNTQLSNEEGSEIVEAFKMLKFKNPNDYIILSGWIAMAQIFGAISWRPHLWLTGEKGSGKTTILNYIRPLLPFSKLVRDATSAGIKQEIKNDTFSIMYDEAEPNSDKTRKRMEEIIELARQCSSLDGSEIWRGTASGKSYKAKPNTVFLFSSIQKFLPTQADVSRFFVLELESTKTQNHIVFKNLEKAMDAISIYGNRLFVRMVKNFDNFIKNIQVVKDMLRMQGNEARESDQLSAVAAGYYMLFETDIMSVQMAEDIIKKIDFKNSDYVRDNSEDESMKCLETIYDLMLPGKSHTIGKCVDSIQNQPVGNTTFYHADLENVGIKYDPSQKELLIASNHHQLKKLLEKTMYSDYAALLRRHERYTPGRNQIRLNGKTRKCICLDMGELI